jgi:hypothetical protein
VWAEEAQYGALGVHVPRRPRRRGASRPLPVVAGSESRAPRQLEAQTRRWHFGRIKREEPEPERPEVTVSVHNSQRRNLKADMRGGPWSGRSVATSPRSRPGKLSGHLALGSYVSGYNAKNSTRRGTRVV